MSYKIYYVKRELCRCHALIVSAIKAHSQNDFP